MKQVIEWKEITKDTPVGEYYYFLSKEIYDVPKIIAGRSVYYDGHNVWITIENIEIKLPIHYFSHYAKVEE